MLFLLSIVRYLIFSLKRKIAQQTDELCTSVPGQTRARFPVIWWRFTEFPEKLNILTVQADLQCFKVWKEMFRGVGTAQDNGCPKLMHYKRHGYGIHSGNCLVEYLTEVARTPIFAIWVSDCKSRWWRQSKRLFKGRQATAAHWPKISKSIRPAWEK